MDELYALLTDDEKEYAEIILNNTKLTDEEFEIKFGQHQYKEILKRIPLKEYIAEKKIEKAKNKDASQKLKLDLLIDRDTRLLGLNGIKKVIQIGPDHKDFLAACKALMKGDESYIANKGKVLAESEADQIELKEFVFAYPISKEE